VSIGAYAYGDQMNKKEMEQEGSVSGTVTSLYSDAMPSTHRTKPPVVPFTDE
jgi:hypothetical protein